MHQCIEHKTVSATSALGKRSAACSTAGAVKQLALVALVALVAHLAQGLSGASA